MNIENLKKLSAFLRTIPQKNFRHGSWEGCSHNYDDFIVEGENVCGTSACVAGWAIIIGKLAPYTVENDKVVFDEMYEEFERDASEWLDLSEQQSAFLFYPFDVFDGCADYKVGVAKNNGNLKYYRGDTTNKEAADFLDLMIENQDCQFSWWIDVKKERVG